MADEDTYILGTVNYWCREKHFRHVQNVAFESQKKYPGDSVLKFFNAFGMLLEGRVQESMREFDALSSRPDVNLCSTLGLIHGHRKAKVIDKESIQMLDTKLKTERKQGTDKSYYLAGMFLIHVEKLDRAQEYVDRAVKMSPQNKDILALKGWLDLLSGDEAVSKKSLKFFEDALSIGGTKCLNALFGKAKYLEIRRNFSAALDAINEAVVHFPQSIPALIEKMKLQVALQDWEQAVDSAHRALDINPNCLMAKHYLILHSLCKEGNYSEASSAIEDILGAFVIEEPQNAFLIDKFARAFCRVSGKNSLVLQQTYALQEKAITVDSDNPAYLSELGYELLLQNRPRDAIRCFNNALKIDESNLFTLTGLLWCQLLENQLQEAGKQLEFLNELKDTIGTSAELMYLNALLCLKRNDSSVKTIELLDKATKKHFEGIKGLPLGTDYFLALNPIFIINIISDYLTFAPQQPLTKNQAPDRILQKCLQLLDPLCRAVPGLQIAAYYLAKTKFLSGDTDGAANLLQRCLEQDRTSSDCHVLMAQIHLHTNNFKMANDSLEVGLSYNFEVREHPVYHLIKARIFKKQGDLDNAVKTLQYAMALPGVRKTEKSGPFGGGKKKAIDVTTNERVSVFIELADAHRQLGQTHEATKVMQDAMNDFHGTGEEVRIAVANADLVLARGDVEGALATLRGIGPEQNYYVKAREKMAEIYLNHRKDKRLYASCYRELAEKYPSLQTSLLLGDAYMSIDEPEKAIAEYESAMKKNPQDYALASKIGQALVKTHQFNKAISYYEASLKQGGGQQVLRYDLAELLLRMKQFEKAEKVLKQGLSVENPDFDTLVEQARYMLLLSRIYHQQERYEEKIGYLMKAKETQDRVLMRANVEQPESVHSVRQYAADICVEIAQFHIQQRDYPQAIQLYREALSHSESNGKIMVELAKLYMKTEEFESCEHQCMTMLKADKETDSANVMLADLMFRKNEFDQAMSYFERLLSHRPDHYAGLEKVIEILRRAGKLEECTKFLDMAEKSSGRATNDAGFNFCKGLYEWYIGNSNKALKHFNRARKDADYGCRATYNMVEICLNPDNETIGGEVFEAEQDEIGRERKEKADGDFIAISTADKLLKEMKPKPIEQRYRILCNMVLVLSKNKTRTEEGLANLLEILKLGGDVVGALYGSAVAYIILKQAPKARNQLKRIVKAGWSMEDADDIEKGWLLFADVYIQSNKYDQATEILKQCLRYNKSCYKAYEYLGYLMEKEQSYKDAAQNYELAWRYANRSNPSIGYKLAFNYLKAKRHVDAIDVCHQVLQSHPTYPKIKKEILDKARSMVRVA